ncbi:GntR family transcriptional regulator [Streptacidiphilus sp. PB12-B1b]|uniref:GntR family transcriptional regulator n=1 Tax=Streptacidiphilus sp. PB12-B1b TaxID=2705012 RepID=UPI0015F9A9CB|nr:GntR family transcriptional regulator [Streptacidiphilus sp. PB12-B1b]QMU75229.1 GntR family transcriptional regulator [Streptacidiphilus sp. PB12-B1b]
MNISRGPGQAPKYQRLAADLRRRIMAGEWQSGEPLPVESELENQYGVARNTVRLAVDVLVNEGLLIRVQGKGTYLKDHPVLDHIAYRSPVGGAPGTPLTPPSAAYAEEADRAGRKLSSDFQMLIVRATADITGRLRIKAGEAVVLRRVLRHMDGEPWSIEESHYPVGLAAGTALMDPDSIVGGDEIALDSAGHVEIGCVDELAARMPNPEEAQWFQAGPGVPLLVQLRTGFTAAGPIRVTETRYCADRNRLVYALGERAGE